MVVKAAEDRLRCDGTDALARALKRGLYSVIDDCSTPYRNRRNMRRGFYFALSYKWPSISISMEEQ